jgi:ppGpp synthetase/RelA/SpoT-type nucleotidyltranferase
MKKSERNEKLRIEQEERDRLHWETFKKDYHIERVTVTAKTRALKAEYSMELAQDLIKFFESRLRTFQ